MAQADTGFKRHCALQATTGIGRGPPWQPGGSPFRFLISAIYGASGLPTLFDFCKRIL